MLTVREFVSQSYRLISASSPTVPLHGDDLSLGIRILNQLLNAYASTGLMLTIAKTVNVPLSVGQESVTIGNPTDVPTPDITIGRLANLENAWINLDNVDYPLIYISQDEFNAAWKYQPLQGLPRFIIVYPQTDIVNVRIYPAPSQYFQFFIRGKFQLPDLDSNADMDSLPAYYQRYLLYALARDLADFKGRGEAWSGKLEIKYQEALDNMVAASEVNLAIGGDRQSLLNGAWRVRSGV